MLSDERRFRREGTSIMSLNAPFGAQCFPTGQARRLHALPPWSQCTFWCSVLSDIPRRLGNRNRVRSQCTFWCSVLSDLSGPILAHRRSLVSQCTFWCSVLSDPVHRAFAGGGHQGLNAPFGAQCFPTGRGAALCQERVKGLNAPFGAQCFPTYGVPIHEGLA